MFINAVRALQCAIEALARSWLLLLFGLSIFAASYSDTLIHWSKVIAIFLALMTFIITHRYVENPSERMESNWLKIGIALLALGIIASIGWICFFDSAQISDFGVYFRCGTTPHNTLSEWVDACQSKYLHKNLIYWNRSLLYTFIVGKFAGTNYLFLKTYNVVWHAATLILWFLGIRYYYGARIAAVATGFLMIYPEWWFTLTLATTDNLAVFFLIAFLLLTPQLKIAANTIWVVIGLAAIMFCANQLRTIGPLLVLTLIGCAVIYACSQRALSPLIKVFFTLILYLGMGMCMARYSPPNTTDPFQLLKAFSAVDFSSRQDFGSNYSWVEHFWLAMPEAVRPSVALYKLKFEFLYNVKYFPLYLYHKAGDLFLGTGYAYFAADPSANFNADTFFTVPKSTVPFSNTLMPWFGAIEIVMLTLSCSFLIKRYFDSVVMASVLWTAVFLLITLGLSEAQPRYSVLIMPVLALLSALALFPPAIKHDQETSGSILKSILRGAACLILTFLLAVVTSHFLRVAYPAPSIKSKQNEAGAQLGQPCDKMPATIQTSYNRLRIMPAPGSTCVSINIPISKATSDLSFFVAGEKFPFLFEPRMRSQYSYQVVAGQRVLLTDSLGENSVRWHSITMPVELRPVTQSLSFIIHRQSSKQDAEPINIWFLNAKHP